MIVMYQSGRLERTQTGEVVDNADHYRLMQWRRETPGLHTIEYADYHRMQLEHWLWERLQPTPTNRRVLDIGVYERRDWIGPGYRTLGNDATQADVVGDLLDGVGGPWDAIVCTEVLEHCADPWSAIRVLYDALEPGGRLLATSPFIWPDHRTTDYPDYWRFTEQGWRLLLKPFGDRVVLTPAKWTKNGAHAMQLVLDNEGMGVDGTVFCTTGWMVEATK